MRLRRLCTVLTVAALSASIAAGSALVVPSVAHAQSPADLAKARTLFKEGVSLEAAGDWAGALAKFNEVAKVKTTPAVRFHIGRCKEHLGRLNEALGEYRMAEYEAQQSKAKELDEISKAREQLEARVPKLTITRGKGAESAKIELDGVALGEAQVGKEVSTDPGPHRIVAKIGSNEFEQTVTVAEGESKSVELVPPDDFKAGPGPVDKPTQPDDKPDEPTPVKVEAKGKGALPWIIGGVGVVGLAAGGFFYTKMKDNQKQLEDVCHTDNVCPEAKKGLSDDGKKYALYTNIGVGVGIVGIGVATVMLLTGGGADTKEKPKSARVRLNVVPGPELKGVNLVGAF